ncbi:MAG: Flp family type IVb pilin [Alphaproteobacteria bacterium]|nr:Flp family type IVb pilin [Alphaproteobacteria bacterium]
MTKAIDVLCRAALSLHRGEEGAAFIEYTVLLGVILAASVATVAAVGTWAAGKWNTLNAALP